MILGDLTIGLAAAVHETRAWVNETEAVHGTESLEAQRARVQLRVAQQAATSFMEASE